MFIISLSAVYTAYLLHPVTTLEVATNPSARTCTNVPLWRCGWATCAVLSGDFLHVYCLFSNTYKQALFGNVLKSFEVWSHFQISSPTFQRKTIGIFNLINLAFESTPALRTSILVTLHLRPFRFWAPPAAQRIPVKLVKPWKRTSSTGGFWCLKGWSFYHLF